SDLVVPASGYSDHATKLPFLLANNTGWDGEAATYDANQAALLAQTGRTPQTTAYTDPWLRYDFTTDSVHARDLTAASAVFLGDATHNENAGETNDSDSAPQVIKLQNDLDPFKAKAVLDAEDKHLELHPITDVKLQTTKQEGGLPLDETGTQNM